MAARSDRNLQTQGAGLIDHWEQIFATEWVAPGKYQVGQGVAKGGDLTQQAHTLYRGQFQRMRTRHRFRATVPACQHAGLGHFPVHQHGISGEVVTSGIHRERRRLRNVTIFLPHVPEIARTTP